MFNACPYEVLPCVFKNFINTLAWFSKLAIIILASYDSFSLTGCKANTLKPKT